MMRFGMGNFNGMRGGLQGMHLFGLLIALVVLALIVLGIIALIRYLHNSNTRANPPLLQTTTSNALNILDERYARGEIDDQEYASKKTELKK